MDGQGPTVVKLGGSFAFSPYLRDWIAAIAGCAGRTVVVPGGGPFADVVRAGQARMGFDDLAAHGTMRAADLAGRDIVDKAFANFLAASGVPAFILGPKDHVAVGRLLSGEPVGIRMIA